METTQDWFAHQKFELTVYGFSASNNIFYRLYSIGLLIMCTIYVLSFTSETVKSSYTNQDFIFSISAALAQIIILICMYWSYFKRFDLRDLFQQVKAYNDMFYKTHQDNKNFLLKYEKVIKKQVYIGRAVVLLIIIIFVLMASIRSIGKESWVLPLGNGPAIKNDNLKFSVEVVMYFVMISIFYKTLFLYINILTLICCYCKLLQHHILHHMSPKEKSLSKLQQNLKEDHSHVIMTWEDFQKKLQYIVPYHVGIIELIHQTEKIFSIFILLFYGGAISAMCLVIYYGTVHVTSTAFIKNIVSLLACYLPLIMISVWGERVTTESEKISAACYEVYCVDSDLRVQKSILIMMMASCKPLTLTIGRLRTVGLQSLVDVSRSVYVYYTVIRSIYN